MPEIDDVVEVEEIFSSVESVKAASDIYMPMTGTIIECNDDLEGNPGVAKTLRDASRLDTIAKLELDSSESFVCKNMMCEHLGNSCGKTWPLLYCISCNTILYCSWLSY